MRERLGEFALSLHPDKTRLIEFGRHAAANRDRRGLGKPETFNFLGSLLSVASRVGAVPSQKENPAWGALSNERPYRDRRFAPRNDDASSSFGLGRRARCGLAKCCRHRRYQRLHEIGFVGGINVGAQTVRREFVRHDAGQPRQISRSHRRSRTTMAATGLHRRHCADRASASGLVDASTVDGCATAGRTPSRRARRHELTSHGLRTDIYPANEAYFMKPLISAMAAALGKTAPRAAAKTE